ncbi:MAG: hypothetical protein ACK5YR_00160 [Pirellula sp.]|jgi:hypothetical protein
MLIFRFVLSHILISASLFAQSFDDEREQQMRFRELLTPFQQALKERDPVQLRMQWLVVSQLDEHVLVPLLDLCEEYSSPAEMAWITTAIDKITSRSLHKLEFENLEPRLLDTKRSGRGRRVVLSILERIKPGYRDGFLLSVESDPEFHRDYMSSQIDKAVQIRDQGNIGEANGLLTQLYDRAIDAEQIVSIYNMIEEQSNLVSLHEKLGLISEWKVIGPFPSEKAKGPEQTYPVESQYLNEQLDISQSYAVDGKSLDWKSFEIGKDVTSLKFGQVLAGRNDSVYFAATTVHSDVKKRVELLASGGETIQLWHNGVLVIDAPFYNQRPRLDRYRCLVELKEGDNTIFAKVCIGEGGGDGGGRGGAPAGELILRIVDENGKGLVLKP